MKTLKLFLVAAVISASSLFTISCGGSEKEANPLADSLANVNGELNGQLSEKEVALQEFVNSFNEIQDNLNAIKEKEKIVTSQSQSGDVKSKEESIKEDIQAIYDLLAKNKNRISSLSKKLKDSKSKITGLEQMIATLQAQIDAKDGEISELKSQLEAKNIELSNIVMNLENVEAESSAKTEKMNTVYYAFGTSKELKEKNVITKEGGFIGMGKSAKLKDDFNKEYFTKVDASQTTSINIGAKKAKIITSHPSSSYKLIGDKTVEKIEITNTEDFWSNSKYLVIITE
ncbi:MAG: chromosome segregation protein [Bacteroidetes bacterium]|jgi:DNA repair exonuclease SbcCD ATPase subunit|nr:chromosome segregation protein [Bacteroidota bacterium]MDF2453117.1 chromosome segregation protein [Bacteroidota bacterium]